MGGAPGGSALSGMLMAWVGSPFGILVTVSLPQLATQMLPSRSDDVPCGHEILPWVNPVLGEIGVPSGRNADTLLWGASDGVPMQGGSWKPKLPVQMLPTGSSVMPKPAPLRPPPK